MTEVSVIIPTRNRSGLLKRAVESVLNQTYNSIEIIIVDDHSTDNTQKVGRRLENDNQNIIYIRNDESLGGAGARNQGVEYAEGNYCAFLDDDDEWLPEKIEKQIEYIDEYSVLGTAKHNGTQSSSNLNNNNNLMVKSRQAALSGWDHISPSTLMTHTTYLREIDGWDQELGGSEGWDMYVRLIINFGPGAILNEKLTIMHKEHDYDQYSRSDGHFEGVWSSYHKHKNSMKLVSKRRRLANIHLRQLLYHPKYISRLKSSIKMVFYLDIYLRRILQVDETYDEVLEN